LDDNRLFLELVLIGEDGVLLGLVGSLALYCDLVLFETGDCEALEFEPREEIEGAGELLLLLFPLVSKALILSAMETVPTEESRDIFT